jgi:hypothetical protein
MSAKILLTVLGIICAICSLFMGPANALLVGGICFVGVGSLVP